MLHSDGGSATTRLHFEDQAAAAVQAARELYAMSQTKRVSASQEAAGQKAAASPDTQDGILKKTLDHLGGVSNFIDRLKVHDGFTELSPSTVWRWAGMEKNNTPLPPRARQALALLSDQVEAFQVRTVVPNNLWMLAPMLLGLSTRVATHDPSNVIPAVKDLERLLPNNTKPYKLNLNVEMEQAQAGREVCDRIRSKDAQIGFVGKSYKDIIERYYSNEIVVIGKVSTGRLLGIIQASAHEASKKEFKTVDFENKKVIVSGYSPRKKTIVSGYSLLDSQRVGYLAGTVAHEIIEHWTKEVELDLQIEESPQESPLALARALADKKVDAILGWEPLLSDVMARYYEVSHTSSEENGVYWFSDFEFARDRVDNYLIGRRDIPYDVLIRYVYCLDRMSNFVESQAKSGKRAAYGNAANEFLDTIAAATQQYAVGLTDADRRSALEQALRTTSYALSDLNIGYLGESYFASRGVMQLNE